jgi:lipoyl(octanoyl) transferase
MALDAALMESVRAGGAPVLRFYRWSPACLSLGRNQPARGEYDEDRIRAAGVHVVRRPTGGRAVLHDRELTYSACFPQRLLGSPRAGYSAINGALLAGLRRLGVAVELQPRTSGQAAAPSLAPCFRDPAEGEVVAGGRKLIGSAQFREGGVLLQHGSLLLEDDQRRVPALLCQPDAGPEVPPAVLADFLAPLPDWRALTDALAIGFAETLGVSFEPSGPTPSERARAESFSRHFGGLAWTWRL